MWDKIVIFVTVGYFSLGRSFAYLGVAKAKLFIGEIVLGLFVLTKPRVALGILTTSLLQKSPLNGLALTLYVFVAFGAIQAARGLAAGAGLEVMKYFVFNYYAFYVFLGLWVAARNPQLLPRVLRILAWVNGVYGIAYLIFLKSVPIAMPGAPVALFGAPNGSAVAILGLLCFERSLVKVWPLLLLNVVVLLGMSVRAEWLGLTLATVIWGLLTGKGHRIIAIAVAGAAVVGLIELADIKIGGRMQIDTNKIISRVIAPINPEIAAEFSPHAAEDGGTLKWRKAWWDEIWISVHQEPERELFGYGYGFDLFSLAPPSVRAGQATDIRTPHNVFYYALGYTGWVGVAIFGLFMLALLQLQWAAFRISGQAFGIAWWVASLAIAFFSNFFETPFQSIPFYLLMGMSMAPVFQTTPAFAVGRGGGPGLILAHGGQARHRPFQANTALLAKLMPKKGGSGGAAKASTPANQGTRP